MQQRMIWIAGLAALAGCHGNDRADSERTALALVAASRSPAGIGPELVDTDLAEQARRLQLVRRATLDTLKREKLLAVLAGAGGPDQQYPPSEWPQKQRERATRGLAATAQGECKATFAPQLAADRVKALTEPMQGVPPEVRAAQQELQSELRDAEAVRLDCQPGHVGVLLVKSAFGGRRAIDLWEFGATSFEVNPNDPAMK